MPNLAILATLPSHAAVTKTLTVGPYNLPLSSIGVPIDSVHVIESGPGGVSSMEFSIIDLSVAYVMAEGYPVDFWDVDRQGPIFKGFIQTWSYRPLPVGRAIDVRCTGIDAVLDWAMIPSLTIPLGTGVASAIQVAWGSAAGVGIPLNVTSDSGTSGGNTNAPLEPALAFSLQYDVVITNATFRDACQSIFDATNWQAPGYRASMWGDMWGGVRFSLDTPDSPHQPDDFVGTFQVYDQSGGAIGGTFTPNELDYSIDAQGIPHQVYVSGANAAGSGIVTDGTGLPGPIASLSDDTSDTGTKRDLIGRGYLDSLRSSLRSSVTLENHNPVIGPANGAAVMERAGAPLAVTIPRVGDDGTAEYRIYSISKTFLQNGNEDWVITFGGQRKSLLRSTRKVTRFVRS